VNYLGIDNYSPERKKRQNVVGCLCFLIIHLTL
jgi:hypothetical protein